MRRSWWVYAGVVFFLTSACTESSVPPIRVDGNDEPRYERLIPAGGQAERTSDGGVVVRGSVFAADGNPAPRADVRLEKVSSGFGLITCFFGCDLPPACSDGDSTTSDGSGRFRLQMCPPAGRDLALTVIEESEETEAQVTMPFFLKPDRMRLPRLRFWRGDVSRDEQSGKVHWRELPRSGFGRLDRYELSLRSSDDSPPLWFRFDALPGEEVDLRVLEDTTGVVRVTAKTKTLVRGGCGGRCRGELWLASRGVAYEGLGVPRSRGTTCFLGRPGGASVDGCYLTDGDLFTRLFEYPCREQFCNVEEKPVGIDLGRVFPLDLIVVRGCPFCRVSVSVDGDSWSKLDESDSDDSLDPVSLRRVRDGTRARYVRVNDAEDLLEVSVWSR